MCIAKKKERGRGNLLVAAPFSSAAQGAFEMAVNELIYLVSSSPVFQARSVRPSAFVTAGLNHPTFFLFFSAAAAATAMAAVSHRMITNLQKNEKFFGPFPFSFLAQTPK